LRQPKRVYSIASLSAADAEKDKVSRARLLAGRALALEGESDFKNALVDYQKAEDLAMEAGCALAVYTPA
jgi:hypothetical protein